MKIDRYELVKNNIYNVYLSNGEVLTLDENVITDNELLLKKKQILLCIISLKVIMILYLYVIWLLNILVLDCVVLKK